MIRRELLNAAVLNMLTSATGKQGDLGRIPVGAVLPYFIVYPVVAAQGTGTIRDPEEDREYRYQITSIGEDYRQTAWMSDRIQAALLARSGNGFTTALVVSGGSIQNRFSNSLGSITKSGEKLYQVDDDYTIQAGV